MKNCMRFALMLLTALATCGLGIAGTGGNLALRSEISSPELPPASDRTHPGDDTVEPSSRPSPFSDSNHSTTPTDSVALPPDSISILPRYKVGDIVAIKSPGANLRNSSDKILSVYAPPFPYLFRIEKTDNQQPYRYLIVSSTVRGWISHDLLHSPEEIKRLISGEPATSSLVPEVSQPASCNPLDRIAFFTDRLRTNPSDVQAHYERAVAYLELGKPNYDDAALVDLFEAIRLCPSNASYYGKRAEAFERKERYDRAIADYTAALQLKKCDPGLVKARHEAECALACQDNQGSPSPAPAVAQSPASPNQTTSEEAASSDTEKPAHKETELTKALRKAAVAEARAREALAEQQRAESHAKAEEARLRVEKAQHEFKQQSKPPTRGEVDERIKKLEQQIADLSKRLANADSPGAADDRAKIAEAHAREANANITTKQLESQANSKADATKKDGK